MIPGNVKHLRNTTIECKDKLQNMLDYDYDILQKKAEGVFCRLFPDPSCFSAFMHTLSPHFYIFL